MINYLVESEKYRPGKITTLLVGEAPPPSGEKYFYVPRIPDLSKDIIRDSSLPSTIFYHYFKKRPETILEYLEMLSQLRKMGIFLVDIIDLPIRIRDDKGPRGINANNLELLIRQIPKLRDKIKSRNIIIDDESIIFLLPRNHYKKELKVEFPRSIYSFWSDFRLK